MSARHAYTRPLGEILDIARAELAVNPTITVSTFDENGVEHRRAANPFASLNGRLARIHDAMHGLCTAAQQASRSMAEFGKGFATLALVEIDGVR